MRFKKNKVICQDTDNTFCDFIMGKGPVDPFEARDHHIDSDHNWMKIFDSTIPYIINDTEFPYRIRITKGYFKQNLLINDNDLTLKEVRIK
jgi:hypothetical protein